MHDFDQFQMPRELAQQLYGYSLFVLNKIDEKQTSAKDSETAIRAPESSPRNGLAVIVRQDLPSGSKPGKDPSMPASDLLFLENILRACQRKLDETLVLQAGEADRADQINSLLEKQEISQVLMFGIGPADLQLPAVFPAFQCQQMGGRKFLWAPALNQLQDQESKKALWASLKQFFGI